MGDNIIIDDNDVLESFQIEETNPEPDIVEGCPPAEEVDPEQPPDLTPQKE
jgi:hypothetical protein